ncbi:RAB24-like protein [Mya arenaria]|uniref:RAB24-like protein n=1 Tax=Mya arenaria TaxID=6604 RepID=A0ABY7FR68_MYAAR|nr:RAB24-like protein [Mya arenaria]
MTCVDCKVVLLGNANTGKTCLLRRYKDKTFCELSQMTVGAAFLPMTETFDDVTVNLGCWDTAGSERFASVTRNYYRGACAAVICYDLTCVESFNGAQKWVSEMTAMVPECKLYLCGTKKDLIDSGNFPRAVPLARVRAFAEADDVQADIFQTSSKTGENIATSNGSFRLESWRDDPRVKKTADSTCCH